MATERTLRLAAWDVDGTLVDSRASIARVLQEAAVTVGVTPPTYDQVRQIVGLSLKEAVEQMCPDMGPDQVAAYAAEYKQTFVRHHAKPDFHEPLYAGADGCLRRLKAEGWLLGMATGKSRRGIDRNTAVYGWAGLFDASFCADDGPSKPHPHMLQLNMDRLGVEPSQTVMIGDTVHDIRMGKAAGTHTIAVSWGFHTVEELQSAEPDRIVHSFDELNVALDAFVPQVIA